VIAAQIVRNGKSNLLISPVPSLPFFNTHVILVVGSDVNHALEAAESANHLSSSTTSNIAEELFVFNTKLALQLMN
jgi:hypothetical protein